MVDVSPATFSACTFYTSFLPTYHSASPATVDEELPPILDTGATHCLLPFSWLPRDQIDNAKRIYLRVASGSKVKALLWENVIYCPSANRPLISVGQMKAMMDIRFIWDDSCPYVILCDAGKRYVIIRASILHHLPTISKPELHAILKAISAFTSEGEVWDATTWGKELGRDLKEFHWSTPATTLTIPEPIYEPADPQTMYSSAVSPDPFALEQPLLSTSHQLYSLDDHDAKTELEEENADDNDDLTIEECKTTILNHPLPQTKHRTNVCTDSYIPQGRLFGAYTTRGEGINTGYLPVSPRGSGNTRAG